MYRSDLGVCPFHLSVEGNKVGVVHDWPNYQCPLNSALVNPPAQYRAMDEFLQLLTTGAFLGGINLQDCLFHWLASPSRRRFLGVRRPVTCTLGVCVPTVRAWPVARSGRLFCEGGIKDCPPEVPVP